MFSKFDGRPNGSHSHISSKGRGIATRTARISPALVIFLCLVFAGCNTQYVAGYDPVMDAGLMAIHPQGQLIFSVCQDPTHVYSRSLWLPLLFSTDALLSRASNTALDTNEVKSLWALDSLELKDMARDSVINSENQRFRSAYFNYAWGTWSQAVSSIDSAQRFRKSGGK